MMGILAHPYVGYIYHYSEANLLEVYLIEQ